MTDFEKLLATLARHEVAFIVAGGAAAIAHGSVRLTQDLDIVYQRSPANLDRLVSALSNLKPYLRGAPPGLPFVWLIRAKRAAGRPKAVPFGKMRRATNLRLFTGAYGRRTGFVK